MVGAMNATQVWIIPFYAQRAQFSSTPCSPQNKIFAPTSRIFHQFAKISQVFMRIRYNLPYSEMLSFYVFRHEWYHRCIQFV